MIQAVDPNVYIHIVKYMLGTVAAVWCIAFLEVICSWSLVMRFPWDMILLVSYRND